MSVEGIWKVEMLGPDGWELVATAFLWNGRYLGAGADHYSTGSYKENGEAIKVEIHTTQHGKIRAVFGSKTEHLDLKMEGRIENTDQIVGRAKPSKGGDFDLNLRLTRLGELD